MDNEIIRNGLMLLQWLTTLALAIYAHNIGKQRATTGAIDKLNERINEKCQRIAHLEGELKSTPKEHHITRLHDRINDEVKDMRLELSKVSDHLNGLRDSLDEKLAKIGDDSKQTGLILGEVLGQLKQINGGK